MRPISSLSMFILGILSSWQMLLFWTSLYILISGFRDKRRINRILRNILLLLLCFADYTLFQCTVGYTSRNPVTPTMIRIVAWYAALPALALVAVCILLTAVEAFLILSMRRWYNTHITSASIKETVEKLPVGICAFEPDGKITLRNTVIEQLCRSLTGLPLLNGIEFVQSLTEKKSDFADFTVVLSDYGVWSFTKDEICGGKTCFTLLVAYNVTEAYRKAQMLAERQKTVQELNRNLLAYNKQIEQVITQQEILNAKVRIHDELGSGLLAIKRYLVSGGTDKERAELLERLKGNILFLQQEALPDEQDEYSLILSTAENLGVSVLVSGTLPQTEPNKHVIATAIHECFTNVIRHTNGNTLYVGITEEEHTITAQFTDNNTQPVTEAAETGGLCSLRDLAERAGGKMQISAVPQYCLTITLPKEAEKYGIPSFDRG